MVHQTVSATLLANQIFGDSDDDHDECCSDDEDCLDDVRYYSDDDELWFEDDVEAPAPKPKTVAPQKKILSEPNPNECSICYDTFDDTNDLSRIRDCHHVFCKECLREYVTFKTSDAGCLYHQVTLVKKEKSGRAMSVEMLKTYGVPCPAMGCKHVMLINELLPVASEQAIEQFRRFSKVHEENLKRIEDLRKEKEKKNEITCFMCRHVNVITKKGHRGRVQCEKCKRPFCSSCGHLHTTVLSCEDYMKKMGAAMAEQMELMKRLGLVKCPACMMLAEKISGCNFMFCRCGQNFCFLCCAALDESKHFSHFLGAPFDNKCNGPKDCVAVTKK